MPDYLLLKLYGDFTFFAYLLVELRGEQKYQKTFKLFDLLNIFLFGDTGYIFASQYFINHPRCDIWEMLSITKCVPFAFPLYFEIIDETPDHTLPDLIV